MVRHWPILNRVSDNLAQRVLAHTLDTLLRLLHPIIPFLTEDVWQRLGESCPERGLPAPSPAAASIIVAPWPDADAARIDPRIESQFSRFQEVLRLVRDIRARQNVPPKKEVRFSVLCDPALAELLQPMEPYFISMAGARVSAMGPDVVPPALSANAGVTGIEVFVDLADLIDVEAELARKKQEADKLAAMVAGKETKLANRNFIDRAPPAVVQKERDSLAELQQQHANAMRAIEQLQAR